MNVKRLLTSSFGKIIISVLMGLGLASLFQKVCKDNSCLIFNGPVISEINGKTYKFGEMCYKYDIEPSKCDPLKRTVLMDSSVAKGLKEEQNNPFSFLSNT
jgi:hypothetical protein